jgi:hypothetical protein
MRLTGYVKLDAASETILASGLSPRRVARVVWQGRRATRMEGVFPRCVRKTVRRASPEPPSIGGSSGELADDRRDQSFMQRAYTPKLVVELPSFVTCTTHVRSPIADGEGSGALARIRSLSE